MKLHRYSLALALVALAACSPSSSTDNDGGKTPSDGGAVVDGGFATDAGSDAGVETDAGSDAGIVTDAGSDAGVETDAGTDAGIETDAGSDAGVETDAGPTDGGTVVTHLITVQGDDWESITPDTNVTVVDGAVRAFTVMANAHYLLSHTVGGTCPAGSWVENVYTTGAITADCSVAFSATLITFTVTPIGDVGVVWAPNTAQTVAEGSTRTFAVGLATGYMLTDPIQYIGTCPVGVLDLQTTPPTYTTGVITADCTVGAATQLVPVTVTAGTSPGVAADPGNPQTTTYGSTVSYTVITSAHYLASETVGGSCPAGSWSGSTYTTGPVVADCTVIFSAALETFTITDTEDDYVYPSASFTAVPYGTTVTYAVNALYGYQVVHAVTGDCPEGTWGGDSYTTGAIVANCHIGFSGEPGPASIDFLHQPATIAAGSCFHTPFIEVGVYDVGLNIMTTQNQGFVMLSVHSSGPETVATAVAPVVNGIATFDAADQLCVTKAGYWIITATYGNFSAGSDVFHVTAADPAGVAFSAYPSSVLAQGLLPSLEGSVVDPFGNKVFDPANFTVSLVDVNNVGGTLTGTLTQSTHSGGTSVTFDYLSIDRPGIYQLKLTGDDGANTLASDTSPPFEVLPSSVLTINVSGLGNGRVQFGEYSCVSSQLYCQYLIAEGAQVDLQATADDGSTFVGWRGPCTVGDDSQHCSASSPSGNYSVTAGFAAPFFYGYVNSTRGVFGVPLTGGDVKQLHAIGYPSNTDPTYIVSASSDNMVFAYQYGTDIRIIDLWKGETRVVGDADAGNWPGIMVGALSPNGNFVAYTASDAAANLKVAATDGSGTVPITNETSWQYDTFRDCLYNSCADSRLAVWTPDSQYLLWVSSAPIAADGAATTYGNIWVASVAGGQSVRVTNFNSDTMASDPRLMGVVSSPSGEFAAFLADIEQGPDGVPTDQVGITNLWTISQSDLSLHAVTDFTTDQRLDIPVWPQDDTLVFSAWTDPTLASTTLSDSRNLFAVHPDGTGLRALTSNVGGGFYNGAPTPYLDEGRTILFESSVNPAAPSTSANVGIWAVPVAGDSAPTLVHSNQSGWDYLPLDNDD